MNIAIFFLCSRAWLPAFALAVSLVHAAGFGFAHADEVDCTLEISAVFQPQMLEEREELDAENPITGALLHAAWQFRVFEPEFVDPRCPATAKAVQGKIARYYLLRLRHLLKQKKLNQFHFELGKLLRAAPVSQSAYLAKIKAFLVGEVALDYMHAAADLLQGRFAIAMDEVQWNAFKLSFNGQLSASLPEHILGILYFDETNRGRIEINPLDLTPGDLMSLLFHEWQHFARLSDEVKMNLLDEEVAVWQETIDFIESHRQFLDQHRLKKFEKILRIIESFGLRRWLEVFLSDLR